MQESANNGIGIRVPAEDTPPVTGLEIQILDNEGKITAARRWSMANLAS